MANYGSANEVILDTTNHKLAGDKLVNNDQIWVVAEDGINFMKYIIFVTTVPVVVPPIITPPVVEDDVEKPLNTIKKIDIIVNGIKEAIAEAIDSIFGGKTTTTMTVDADALKEKLEREMKQLPSGKSIEVLMSIPGTTDSTKKASLESDVLKQLVDSGSSIVIDTLFGRYLVDNRTLTSLAGNSNSGNLIISISKFDDNVQLKAIQDNVGKNVEILSNLVRFEVSADGNNVDRFDNYVTREVTMSTANSINPTTGVVVGFGGILYHVPSTLFSEEGVVRVGINSLTNSVYGVVTVNKEFTDIKDSNYVESINNMASRMIMNGTSDTKFSPDKHVTRVEFSDMLVTALGLYRGELGKSSFKDLSGDIKINIGITVAADNGLVAGYTNGEFMPNNNITQKEFAQMLYRAASVINRLDLFDNSYDGVIINDWSYAGVKFVTSNNLIENFDSKSFVTREQVAFALEQFLLKTKLINE